VRKRFDDYVNSGGEVKGPYGHLIVPQVGAPAVVSERPVVTLK
jgi:pilus assembly protein CpaC